MTDNDSAHAADAVPTRGSLKLQPDFVQRVREATRFLEQVRDDYESLSVLTLDERQRFLMAAGQVARPGPWAKRELAHAARERETARKRAADKQLLDHTGIRQSRRQSIFRPWQHGATIDRTGDGGISPNILEPAGDTTARIVAGGSSETPAEPATATASAGRLSEEQHCYICKNDYQDVHVFYDALCPKCAAFNWDKRTPQADLTGRVAIVTGARVKIGFHAALMLLRSGCHVVVTTRFPHDAATRYAAEPDAGDWLDRLEIFGLDLRHTPSVETFAKSMAQQLSRLDFIINNACQTVRRPAGFYDHLMREESRPLEQLSPAAQSVLQNYDTLRNAARLAGEGKALPATDGAALQPHSKPQQAGGALLAAATAVGLRDPAALSQLTLLEEDLSRSTHIFPKGQLDGDLQQVDLRDINSWRLPLADVSAVELLEVQLVNAVAPFILNARLKTVMLRTDNRDKHIVNVSAVEGQFSRRLKTDRHPHTNMAKAALNMMTRTSAADYVRDGIHMNSVDTGWVTDEDPAAIAARKTREQGFHPPLDIVDGAARIVDPIFNGLVTGTHTWGAFLKDYVAVDW